MPYTLSFAVVLALVSLAGCYGDGNDSVGQATQRGNVAVKEMTVLTDEFEPVNGRNVPKAQAGHCIEIRTILNVGSLKHLPENRRWLENLGVNYDVVFKADIENGKSDPRQTTLGGDCLQQVKPGEHEFVVMLDIPTSYDDDVADDADDRFEFQPGEYYLVASIDPQGQIDQDSGENGSYPRNLNDVDPSRRNIQTIYLGTDQKDKNDVILHSVALDSDTIVLDGYEDGGNGDKDGTLDNAHLSATLDIEVTGNIEQGKEVPITARIETSDGAKPLRFWDPEGQSYVEQLSFEVKRMPIEKGDPADDQKANTRDDGRESVHVALRIPGDPEASGSTRFAVEKDMGDDSNDRQFKIHFYANEGGDEYEGRRTLERESDNEITVDVVIVPPAGDEVDSLVRKTTQNNMLQLVFALESDVDVTFGNETTVQFEAWIENIETTDENTTPWPDGYYTCTVTKADPKTVSVDGVPKVVWDGFDPDPGKTKYKFTERSRLLPSVGEQQSYEKGFGNSTFGASVKFDWGLTLDGRGLIAAADGGVPVSVLGRRFDFLRVDTHGGVNPSDDNKTAVVSFGLDVVFVGQTLYSLSKSREFRLPQKEISFQKSVEASARFTIGPVPVEVTGSVGGELGLKLATEIGTRGGENAPFNLRLTAGPFVSVDVAVSGGVSVGVAKAGIEGSSKLIEDTFQGVADGGVQFVKAEGKARVLKLDYLVKVENQLEGPALELALFASWKAPKLFGFETRKARKVLLRWQSFKRTDTLLENELDPPKEVRIR